jgi:4-hydroxy-tetrahydrodipicolinate synthase
MSWSGVFPYLATPLTADEQVHAHSLRLLVDRVIDAGVHGVTSLGSTGEFPYLSRHAREEVIALTVEAAAGRVPVVVGVGGFSVDDAVRQAKAAERLGADGLLCILQAYFPLNDREIVEFFRGVAGATDLPVVVYHHPGVCHVRIAPAVAETLADIPTVAYMKEASGTMDLFTISPRLAERGMRLFAATALSPTAAMLFGATGWMSGPACVFPGESVRLYELCRSGEWEAAAELERALDSVLVAFRRLGPAASVKALLRADGLDVGHPMAPVDGGDDLDIGESLRLARLRLAEAIGEADARSAPV